MSKDEVPVIVWFRQDLRLRDNPALLAAHESGQPIIPLYILDDVNSGEWSMGAASRWWLHQSLDALNKNLDEAFVFESGNPESILSDLVAQTGANKIYWNRCYEPWRIKRDKAIKLGLSNDTLEVKSFNGALLFEPHRVLKENGTPYRVFTPFYKKGCLGRGGEPRTPTSKPEQFNLYGYKRLSLDDLKLMPAIAWYDEMQREWSPGEDGAQACLNTFLQDGLKGYKDGRNFPVRQNVSRLSPYLHFGEISPNDVWYGAQVAMVTQGCENDGEHFLSEIGWREFSNTLLYHFPNIPHENLQTKFDAFPWREDVAALKAWQRGQTGYPIVDAGMRELWQTGYMHNRVRMIVGSFLIKNLLLHWHHGENWFWDTLVDADLANNAASWQWIAGCGADAAPYFRIFNPVTQGQKFDGAGEYVRRFVPELAKMPDKFLHNPWEAPDNVLEYAGVKLGAEYPKPIVNLKASRERALAAFKHLSGSSSL
jgi:deoxyribodipyrimidine photo-lyase